MADVYSEIFYHFVWATKLRHPYLTPEIELLVWDKMRRKCQELEVRVFALDGMPDHLHLVCDVPPKLAAARLIKHVKGSSSHLVNHFDERIALYWQVGYSAHTFSTSALSSVVM